MTPRSADPAAAAAALARARRIARLWDARYGIPGTPLRFGVDALVGLIPGIGDLAGLAPALHVQLVAARFGVPVSTRLAMAARSGLDAVVGSVPLLGDLFDVAYRSNQRNVASLERALARRGLTRSDARSDSPSR